MTSRTTHHAPRRKKRPPPQRATTESTAPADAGAPATHEAAFIEPDHRRAMISDAAYFRAEKRDFSPGHDVDDWLEAEQEIDSLLDADTDEAGTGCGT